MSLGWVPLYSETFFFPLVVSWISMTAKSTHVRISVRAMMVKIITRVHVSHHIPGGIVPYIVTLASINHAKTMEFV